MQEQRQKLPLKAHCKHCGAAVCFKCGKVIGQEMKRNLTGLCRRCTVLVRNADPKMQRKMARAHRIKAQAKYSVKLDDLLYCIPA